MIKLGKRVLEQFPGGGLILKLYKKIKFNIYFPIFKGKEALFTEYYKERIWGDAESYSGPGSTLSYTEPLRKQLPVLLKNLEINSILDAPCGDFNWFNKLRYELSISYIGGDIVKPLIEQNSFNFGNEETKFQAIDITKDELPNSELWLCRDCLIHFSNADIKRALSQFLNSDIQYLLTTTHPQTIQNTNIATGEVRLLNLEAAPFNFDSPIKYVDDWVEGHPLKKLALWHRSMIEDQIKQLIN